MTIYATADLDTGTTITGGTLGTDELVISQGVGTSTVDGGYTYIDKITYADKAGDNTSDVTLTMTSYATAAIEVDASALDAGEDATLNLGSGTTYKLSQAVRNDSITGGTLNDVLTGNGNMTH